MIDYSDYANDILKQYMGALNAQLQPTGLPPELESFMGALSGRLKDVQERLAGKLRRSTRAALTQESGGLQSALANIWDNVLTRRPAMQNIYMSSLSDLSKLLLEQPNKIANRSYIQALTQQIQQDINANPHYSNALKDLFGYISNWYNPPQVTQPPTQPQAAIPPQRQSEKPLQGLPQGYKKKQPNIGDIDSLNKIIELLMYGEEY